jgi:hypothetical protein
MQVLSGQLSPCVDNFIAATWAGGQNANALECSSCGMAATITIWESELNLLTNQPMYQCMYAAN